MIHWAPHLCLASLLILSYRLPSTVAQFESFNATTETLTSQNTTDQSILGTNTTDPNGEDYSPADGEADDLADYLIKQIGEFIGGEDHKEAELPEVTSTSTELDLQNCSSPASLRRYCSNIPADVDDYFQHDLSVQGLLNSLFPEEIVSALQFNCTPGSWCLDDSVHQMMKKTKESFYLRSPFCSDAMWLCLNNIQEARAGCQEQELEFLMNVVPIMCDMEDLGTQSEDCFARMVEAFAVTFADLTHPAGSQEAYLNDTDCNPFKEQITKMYLCADDCSTFDQEMLLESFYKWRDISRNAAEVAVTCNLTRTCQGQVETDFADDGFYNYYDNYGAYDDEEEEEEDEYGGEGEIVDADSEDANDQDLDVERIGSNSDEEDFGESVLLENKKSGDVDQDEGYEATDRSMMLGLIVMTSGLLMGFLALAFLIYRRFQRARQGNYRWDYSQLTTEDGKAIQTEYK